LCGKGPAFLCCQVFSLLGHSSSTNKAYQQITPWFAFSSTSAIVSHLVTYAGE
jgi:hypothetical protein